jgi:pyrroloquinoline-quinone synthase
MDLSRDGASVAGLAAIYVYESQMPAVADAKIDGLKRFYGIDNDDAVAFFSVHREADADHARTSAGLIEKLADTPESEAEVITAADRAIGALYTMLDGIDLD